MAYTKQTWADNDITKPLSAARMNYLEDGIFNAHNLLGGSTGPAIQKGLFVRTVAGSTESAEVKAACNYVCDNVADEVQINAALSDVGTETINKGANGGIVILIGRRFTVANSIGVPTQTSLVGMYGKGGTWITRATTFSPGTSRGIIQLATEDTQYTTVRGLGIDGTNGSINGIFYSNDRAQEWDAFHTVNDMYIMNCGGDGIQTVLTSANGNGRFRGAHFSQIRVINAGRYGLYVASNDSFYDRIDCGSSGSHGIYVTNGNNRFVDCKSWFSQGNGFQISGVRNTFVGCESQDNSQHGYAVASAHCQIVGCQADSNSNGNTGLYDGFNITSSSIIQGCHSYEKNEGGTGLQQRWGYNVAANAKVLLDGTAWQNLNGALTGTGAAGSLIRVVNI